MKKLILIKIGITLVLVLSIISLSGCTSSENNNSTLNNNTNTGENFSFSLTDGTTAELKDYRGKIVILDLWATWCTPCQYQMLELKKAYETYSHNDIEILSINVDSRESNADIKDFIQLFEENGYTLNWVFGNEIDNTDKYKKQPDSGIPSICFFDRNGEIAYKHEGIIWFDEIPDGWTGEKTLLEDKIDELINQ
jgi:thiol-disulfide isomerase/thioredoxin